MTTFGGTSPAAASDDVIPAALASLLDEPAPAVLTTMRVSGEPTTGPVWFVRDGDAVRLVIAASDPKLAHLRAHPRCVLVVFEAVPPFRGLRIAAEARIVDGSAADLRDVREKIASRYLGAAGGAAFADARGDGAVVSLSLAGAKTWDLGRILP